MKVLKSFSCENSTTLALKARELLPHKLVFRKKWISPWEWYRLQGPKIQKEKTHLILIIFFSALAHWNTEEHWRWWNEVHICLPFWVAKIQQKFNREKPLGARAWTNLAHMLGWCWDLSLDHCAHTCSYDWKKNYRNEPRGEEGGGVLLHMGWIVMCRPIG